MLITEQELGGVVFVCVYVCYKDAIYSYQWVRSPSFPLHQVSFSV